MKRNANHDTGKAMTIRFSASRTALLLPAALLLGACACAARADDSPVVSPEADASRLVEDVLRRAGSDDLGKWTRSLVDRALERAGETAGQTVPGQSRPLPAESHAEGFAARHPASAEVLIFTSLSVPAASWRQWARAAAVLDAPLVMRGVGAAGLPTAARAIRDRLGDRNVGIAIDPRLFRLFDIGRVPAVVVVPGGVAPCGSRGCAGDSAPPHDRIAGNIGLGAALEAIAAEGDVGHAVAKAHLARMRDDGR